MRPALLPCRARAIRSAALALCGALLALATTARADDTRYQDYPVGSRAMVFGGAYAAISDDPSGLTYNPAGMVDTHKLNVSVSASLYGFERQGRPYTQLIDGATFSLATLASVNVIPGEAGSVKGFGEETDQGSKYAYGLDITVPSFRTYGTDSSGATLLNTHVVDRTFDAAAGFAMRIDRRWSVGAAVHFNLRIFDDTEDALVTNAPANTHVGDYHAEAAFSNAALSLTLGGKLRLDDGWLLGASIATPGVRVYSAGSVQLQDVVTDSSVTPTQTTVSLVNPTAVESMTGVPLVLRLGAAKVVPKRWTASAQLTFDAPTSYDRFQLDPSVAQRLQLQTHVARHGVLNGNLGGEYLVGDSVALGLGFFTDFTSAPALQSNPDGSIVAGTSHLDHVSLYGGTASVALLGQYSSTRIGLSVSYGTGDEAVPNDPTGISNPNAFTESPVNQLMLYVFVGGSFAY